MACVTVYNPSSGAPGNAVSVTDSQVMLGGSTGPGVGGYYVDGTACFSGSNSVTFRLAIAYGTGGPYTDFTGTESASVNIPDGIYPPYYTNIPLIAAGLDSETTFYAIVQVSDDGSNWDDAANSEFSFTTLGGAPGEPIPTFILPADKTSGQEPHWAPFDDETNDGEADDDLRVAWQWSFSDGQTALVQDPTIVFTGAGTYTATMTVSNAAGSSSTSRSGYVTVTAGNPTATFTADTTTGFTDFAVAFTDNSTNSPSQWLWSFGDQQTSAAQNPTHTYTESNSYTVTLTATNSTGTGSVSVTELITVGLSGPSAVTFVGAPLIGVPPHEVQFLATATGNTTGFSWDFGDTSTGTGRNPTHLYAGSTAAANTYTVTVSALGPAGASPASVSASRASYVNVAPDTTYLSFLEEVRRALLLNYDQQTVCDDFNDWGGIETILRYAHNRICRVQLEAGPLRKTSSTLTAVSPGVLTLPADLIEIRALYADNERLFAVDPRMADLTDADWQETPAGDYLGWYVKPGNSLEVNLVPNITPSSFLVYYTYTPPLISIDDPCDPSTLPTFPYPYILRWIIKYGVLADMLGNEGEMYDLARAQACEQIFAEGIQLIKLTLEGD
jgi:PKD repeat protein